MPQEDFHVADPLWGGGGALEKRGDSYRGPGESRVRNMPQEEKQPSERKTCISVLEKAHQVPRVAGSVL